MMTAKQKFSEEKDQLKINRINRILETAFRLFSQNGIDTIAMTDIAQQAEIGVASLYRYFSTKDEIAIKTVIWAWEKQKSIFFPELTSKVYNELEGINQIKVIFDQFIKLYENQQEFLRLIYFFDSYAVRNQIEKSRLSDYEKSIFSVQDIVKKAISKGFEDCTIKSEYKEYEDVLYYSLMHSFFSCCQKLSLSKNMLKMDEKVRGKSQLEILSRIIIEGIKN